MTATLIKPATPELKWHHSSPWANPKANDYYTMPVEIKCPVMDDITKVNFFVSNNHLVFQETRSDDSVWYYDLGRFYEVFPQEEMINNIKTFANFVLQGYMINQNLSHVPGVILRDDVDEKFNPL